jgi:prolyl oligopeptidase
MFRQPKLKFDPAEYETRQVTYKSKDGTEIPMFLVGKKGLKPTGELPTYLYGYGGFNISINPDFSSKIIAWVERGFLYAAPSLRGGGEFGEAWHQAGMLDKKQTVFDDFAAAAQYLVREGWTKPSRIAISGRSNGGLLVGATLTQHPELFGAALAGVGVMDMLRFHKFTIGHAWTSEYGSADVANEFPTLRAYSPLHNLRAGTKYPATLVVTGDHDDRVVPAHSFKFIAMLQAAQVGPAPTLIRIDVATGHGAGKPLTKQIEEAGDSFAFLAHALGVE